jgi:hypothetical protein
MGLLNAFQTFLVLFPVPKIGRGPGPGCPESQIAVMVPEAN